MSKQPKGTAPTAASGLLAALPEEVDAVSRRQVLAGGVSLTGYLSLASLFGQAKVAKGQSSRSFPLQRKLVWINMSGGWDILEVLDPKRSSTSGIDMIYSYDESHRLTNGSDDARLGRWLPNMAEIGRDMLILRGLAMGTTSHEAGSIYMDTGILSNAGRVNSASIPAIVASEGTSTIPIIQLNNGSAPSTDRGLLKPVSVVRAENLELYRSMYPRSADQTERRLMMLDYIKKSITRLQEEVSPHDANNDRILSLATAEDKVRQQFIDDVGSKLALTQSELAAFNSGAPQNMRGDVTRNFALAQKLLTSGICDCINLGIGGFDTHSNQSASLQPTLASVDFVIKRFVDSLRSAGILDRTLIVMYSDFGRTPKVNNSNGRDHWPVGGALMMGGGIDGGRAVGGTDNDMRALDVNPTTGQTVSSGGQQLNPTHLGGAVLELTLGSTYLEYRDYLKSLPALTRLKTS